MATTQIKIAWPRGVNTMYAGMPVDQYGVIANDSTAVGIVTGTVNAPNRVLTVLTSGTWDETISRQNGIALSDACRMALSAITFVNGESPVPEPPEEPIGPATLDVAGIVKMAAAVAPATDDAPETAINATIAALVGAGIMAEYVVPAIDPPENE